jgi:hypothetical protein
MKPVTKRLTIASFEIRDRMEGRYALELWDPAAWLDEKSSFTLTTQDMIRFGLDPQEELVSITLELTLKPVSYSREFRTPDTVLEASSRLAKGLRRQDNSSREIHGVLFRRRRGPRWALLRTGAYGGGGFQGRGQNQGRRMKLCGIFKGPEFCLQVTGG